MIFLKNVEKCSKKWRNTAIFIEKIGYNYILQHFIINYVGLLLAEIVIRISKQKGIGVDEPKIA